MLRPFVSHVANWLPKGREISNPGREHALLQGGCDMIQSTSTPHLRVTNGFSDTVHSIDAMSDDLSLSDPARTPEGRLGPVRPRPHKVWRTKYVKLMVVGDSGLGKTTLICTLMAIPGEKMKLHDGSETSASQFRCNPASLCTTISWKSEEDRTTWVYRIQDTPGYGDELNVMSNINLMTEYIDTQNQLWHEQEMSDKRGVDPANLDDPRVDLCLFCLPPHRIRPVDVRFMYELAKVVPILPVVTKADTMTIREAERYRAEVYDRLRCPNLPGITQPINTFQFSEHALARANMPKTIRRHIPPFLVVASNLLNEERLRNETPMLWPERVYPWGTSEAFNEHHSDLIFLRALLLQESLEEVSEAKKLRFEAWRSRAMAKKGIRPIRMVKRLLLLASLAAGAGMVATRASGVQLGHVARAVADSVQEQRKARRSVPEQESGSPAEAETAAAEEPQPARKGWWN